MGGTTPLLTDDQFKNLFEKKGAVAEAAAPGAEPNPTLPPPHPARHGKAAPAPAGIISDEGFNKLFGPTAEPVEEGLSGTHQDNPQDFNFQPKIGQDNQLLRAQDQGFLTQTAKEVGNTLANIPLDMIQAIGYTGELLDMDNHDYTNALVDITEKGKNPFGEVYRTHPNQTFDLADPAWWLNNIGGFAEGTAQFIVPGEAEAAGIGELTKAVSTGLKLTKESADAIMGAGHIISAAHIGYLMAAQSGRQIYADSYDTNYHRLMEQGLDPFTADEQAKQISSHAAASAVQTATTLNTLFGMAALSPMFRSNENKIIQWLGEGGSRQEEESLEAWKGRLQDAAKDPDFQRAIQVRPLVSLQGYPAQALQIGLMGIGGEYADKVGKEIAAGKSRDNVDYISDFFDKVTDQQGALNFLTGIVGGPIHALLIDNIPIHRVQQFDGDGKPIYKKNTDGSIVQNARGEDRFLTKRVSARTRDDMGNRVFYNNMKDAIIKDVDWYSQKQGELAKATQENNSIKAEQIRQEMFAVNNLNAVSMGLGDNWKKEYQDISSLDNTQDLGQAMQPQVDTLTQAIAAAKEQGQDTTAAEQQLQQTQAQQQKLAGKTDAMLKGFSRGTDDNEYKQRAARSIEDLDWMKKTYDNLRNKYVSIHDPNSEELAYHVFAREAEIHLMDHVLDDERNSILRDQGILDPIQTYHEQAKVSDAVGQRLNDDVFTINRMLQENDIEGLRKMAGKYGVPAYGDHMINTGIEETIGRIKEEIHQHEVDATIAEQTLKDSTGFTDWGTKNKGKNFQDYLDDISRRQPIDDRIAERKVNLEEMQAQRDIRKENLDKIKSAKGIEEFKKNAKADIARAKKEIEMQNMKDTVKTFMKQQDMTAAERIRKVQLQGEHGKIQQRILHNIARENDLKKQIQDIRDQVARGFLGSGREEKLLARKRKIRQLEEELAHTQKTRSADNERAQQLSDAVQAAAHEEDTKASLTRDQVESNPNGVDHTQAAESPEAATVPPAPEPATTTGQNAEEDKSIEDYVSLKDQLSSLGAGVKIAVENLETLQDPDEYSFDMAQAALEPFVDKGEITPDMAHEIMVKQKAYLEQQAMEQFNASVPRNDLAPTPLPPGLQPEVEPLTSSDITGPAEPFTPMVNMSPAAVATPEEAQKIDQHIGAKVSDSMKINTAAIQYMEVVRHPKGRASFHTFLPLYDKLDPSFNKNILKPGFISEGDEITFHVDTDWKGKVNYDKSLQIDDYGDPMKRSDRFEDYAEDGKIRMKGEGYTYENVPIKIIHSKSGEVVGYLPRTDWVTAQYAAEGYRNMVDAVIDDNGEVQMGNVEAQKQKLLTVRRIISLHHNNEGEEPIRSRVTPRDNGGHPFYSMDVNRNTEKMKLAPKLGKTMLPDPKLKFGLLNGGTVFTGHNTPLEGRKNFTREDLMNYGKPGQEANNIPMVILPMPNGGVSVSPLYTRSLSDRPADIHTIARAIEAHLSAGTNNAQHQKWRDAISKATGADGNGKPLDITNRKDLESFINQYYTYTQHFRSSDTAFDAKVEEGKTKTPRFMLDIPEDAGEPIKIGTSWSGQSPVNLTLDPTTGKLSAPAEEALTEGLSSHYKNIVYSRGDIRGLNDSKPFHSITIKKDGNTRVDKHANYNEYLKSFADTIVYGHHQAEDGTYLYGANPVTNFDFAQIASTRIGSAAEDKGESTIEDDDIFSSMFNPLANPVVQEMGESATPPPPGETWTLEHVLASKNVSIESINENINKLYDTASANPEQTYTLDLPGDPKAKIKLGDKSSISMTKLASMFDQRPIPYNIKLSDDFMSILQNTPKRFLNNLLFEDSSMYAPLPYDEKILGQQIREMFVPMRDESGKDTGVFDAERQTEVVDNVIQALKVFMDKGLVTDSVQQAKDLVKNNVFAMMKDKYERIAGGQQLRGMEAVTPEQAKNLAAEYGKILRSFDTAGVSFWGLALDKLKALGINVVDNGRREDPDVAPMLSADGTDPLSTFAEEATHGLRDWSDVSFESDPKETATARMKMFLATTPDSKVGPEDTPREVQLSFTDPKVREQITKGAKQFTTRTPEQVEKMGLKLGEDVVAKVDGKLMRVTPMKNMDESDAVVHEQSGIEEGVTPTPGDMLLRMQPYAPKENVLTTNKNYLGLPKLADYEELFESVLGKLANQPKDFNTYLSILRNEGNQFHPNLRALAEKLDKAPTEIKNEFVSVVSLQYQPFTMVLLDQRRDGDGNSYHVLRTIEANRGSQVSTIVDNWQQNQKYASILKKNSAGITVIDDAKAKELKQELSTVNTLFTKGDKTAIVAAERLMRKVFEVNGITLPEKAIESFINFTDAWTKKTSVAGGFRRQFSISDKGEPLGVISTMIQKLSGAEMANDNLDEMEDKSYMLTNPLYTEKTSINVLARLAAAHSKQLYSNTHLSSEGKSIYDYGFNSSLSRDVQRIKADPAFRAKFADVDVAKKSWLLDFLNNNSEGRERFQLNYLDGLKVAYMPGASGTTRPDMSNREQLLTSIGMFINQGDPKYAHYLSLTHSDKSTTPVFRNAPRLREVTTSTLVADKLSGGQRAVMKISEEAINRLHDVFHSEYDRITRAKQVGDYNNPKYEEGSQYFYFLPQMNYDEMKKAVGEGKLQEKIFNKIWVSGQKQLNVKEAPGFKEAVQYMLTRHVDDLTNNTLHEWRKNEIIDDKHVPFDGDYTRRLLKGIGINSMKAGDGRYTMVDRGRNPVDPTVVNGLTAQLAARDYAVNHYLMNVSMSQIFYGDPAQVWKGSIAKTMTEYGKRLAKDIAPGRELAFQPGETFTSITARDFRTSAPYLSHIEGLAKAYAQGHPLEATDAQELTTVKEHLDVMHAAGRITDKVYKEMQDIITKAKGGYYEFTNPHHLDVVMQPAKPVYVGDRPPVNGALLNDYVKSSSYPLYPPFLAGKELDKVRTAMEKGNIARLNFETAHKIGVPSNPVDLFNAKGEVQPGVFDSSDWTGHSDSQPVASARQEMSRDNFRIQQEVPYDEDKDSIRTVSQMNKLITQGLPLITTPFRFDGRDVSAKELMGIKEDLRKQLFEMNRQKLLPKIGAEIRDGKMVITDRNKLFDVLQKRALEGNLGLTANDLSYLQEANRLPNSDQLVIPLMFAPSSQKFESMLMSMVSDLGQVKMPGKSYIQASPAGQQSVKEWENVGEEAKKKIVWVGNYDGSALKTVRPGEKGEALQPAQVIAPFRFRIKGKPAHIEDYIVKGEDGRQTLDATRVPPELLQMIGARIPNQGHNSMLPIEIVGFTPPEMGDLVIVPAAITKQMGADFDVDKLYGYQRAYEHTDGAFHLSQDEGDQVKNRYIDMHWSVLTHPDMLKNILNPLDKEDLKSEAALISKWEEKLSTFKPTYYDPMYQLRDFQAQKDAKRLVGLSSLSVTFNSTIQDKDIRPGILDLDADGKAVSKPLPISLRDEGGKLRQLSTLSGYGQSTYTDGVGKGGDVAVRSKHDNHTTVQSEVVDYAKNKVSDKVHLSTYTYPASAALTQLQEPDKGIGQGDQKLIGEGRGWAAHLGYNARLFSQPVIQDYVSELSKRGDSLSGEFTPDLKKAVALQLLEHYSQLGDDKKEPALTDDHAVGYNDLTDSLRASTTVESFNRKQAEALRLFMQLDEIGTQMLRAQSTINQDTAGAGATLLDTFAKERTRENLDPTSMSEIRLMGTDSLYARDGDPDRPTEQGYLYTMVHDAAHAVVGGLYPYREMMPIFEYIMEHTNRQDLSVDTQKNVFNSVKSYLFSHPQLGFWADPEVTRANLLYRRGDNLSLADRVHEAKNTWGQNNYFLQRLQVEVDPDQTKPSYISYQASKASRLDDYENTKAWLDLFLSPSTNEQKLGEDLVRYTYLTGGIQDARSFVKYVPYSYLVGTDFGHKLRELTGDISKVIRGSDRQVQSDKLQGQTNFKEQWFQHNPQFARSLSTDMQEIGKVEKYPETFSLPIINREDPTNVNNPASPLVVKIQGERGKIPAYPDYLSYRSKEENRWVLYKKLGREDYMRIDTLGDKNMDEYSVGEGGPKRSLIAENRSRMYDNIEPAFRSLQNPLIAADKTIMDEMGIRKSGDYRDMQQILDRLSHDPQVPEHARVVSSFLTSIDERGAALNALEYVAGTRLLPQFSFKRVDEARYGGLYDVMSREMEIVDNQMTSKGIVAETINHEMIHSHTAFLTMMSESEDYLRKAGYTGDQIQYFKHIWDAIKTAPGLERAMNELEDVRVQAESKLREYVEGRGISYEQRSARVARGILDNDLDRLIYSMNSRSEFITGAMTEKGTMHFLNDHPYDNKRGFLARVGEIARNIMQALGRVFGYAPARGSLLEAALDKSINLMTIGKVNDPVTIDRLNSPNNMDFTGKLASPITPAGMVGLDKVIGKLEEQKGQLMDSLTGRLSKEDLADKRAKIDEMTADIENLNTSLSIGMLTDVGKKHLDWIQKTIDKKEATDSEIMTSSRVLEVWTNLVDLLYNDNTAAGADHPVVEQDIANLYTKAQLQRVALTAKMKTTLINTSDNIIGMKDFTSGKLSDIDRMQGLTRGLSSAATSKVTQYVAGYMENVARHRDEDTVRLVDDMQALEKKMTALAGGKHNLSSYYNQFFQDNANHSAWGLVQRFSQDWYDFRRSARASRDRGMQEISARGGSAKEKQAVWQQYWKKMNDNAVFADTRMLFDQKTGALKTDERAMNHRAMLEREVGKETADELVEDARQRYGKYLEQKQVHFDDLDGEVDAGTRPKEEAERLKDEFVARYSPNVFFDNFKSKLAEFKMLNSDYYVKMAPKRQAADLREDAGHFYDSKYEEIQKSPETKKVYDHINDTLQSLKESLPVHVQQQMGRNFMPAVAKSMFTDILDVPHYIRTLGERMINEITASAQEELEGANSYNKIPIRYTTDDRKNLPLEMRSRDIPRMIEAFGMMALHYKHFADAKDYIDMGETVLREIDKSRGEGSAQMEQNGKLVSVKAGLRNTMDALKYMKDYLMYKKTRQLEGKTETMLYSPNLIRNFKITHTVKELVSEREKIHQGIANGDIDPSEGSERIKVINDQLASYEGRRLYGSKVGDKLITINQLKTLSYNPFSGIANMGFGVISAAIHANGRTDFGWKELGQAYKIMGHSMLKWGSLGSKDSATAEKVLNIMDRLGIIGDVIDSHYGKIKTRERQPGWKRAINPYNLMRSGDYYMKGLTTVAMLMHDKVEVTEGGEKKSVSLWEAFNHDGEWDARRFGENKAWQSEDVTEQKELDKFRNKAIRVNMIIHGNQDKNSPKLANKYILGRLIGQFRMSWLPEGWYSRFESEREDIQLGRTIKGRYATIKDLGLLGYAAVTLKQLGSLVMKVDPYTGTSRLDGKPMSAVDIDNMRRNFAELGFISAMAGTIITLKSIIDPDGDDKLKWSLRMLANQLIRNQQDLEFYASPTVFDSITKNVIPATDVLKDYWKAMKATARVMTDDDYEASKWILAITHAGLPIPQATLVNKFKTAATKDLDTLSNQ